MGRWAQAQRRGGFTAPVVLPPLPEFFDFTLPEENEWQIDYTGDIPPGVNQWEAALELISVGSGADDQNGSAGSPIASTTCNVFGADATPRAAQVRARWLVSHSSE
jgi:hypothetical protein